MASQFVKDLGAKTSPSQPHMNVGIIAAIKERKVFGFEVMHKFVPFSPRLGCCG